MLQSVEFPLRPRTENEYRGMHYMQRSKATKAERAAVGAVLLTTFQRLPNIVDDAPNRYRVTLTRIAPRKLDDDNVRGTLKGTRDEVAEWIGLDDGSHRIEWVYEQERGAKKHYAVRIKVEDRSAGVGVVRVLSGANRLAV